MEKCIVFFCMYIICISMNLYNAKKVYNLDAAYMFKLRAKTYRIKVTMKLLSEDDY